MSHIHFIKFRQTFFILSLSISLWSCKKSDTVVEKDKKVIENVFICFERPVLSISNAIFVGVRYSKNYTEQDKVSLTINDKAANGTGPRNYLLEGTNYHFIAPAVTTSGDVEVVLTIENNQGTFTYKKTLRIVNDFDVETVWDKLDNAYLLKSFPLMNNASSIDFVPIGNYSLGFAVPIGFYYAVKPSGIFGDFSSFLNGLNGAYIVNYDNAKKLTDITIINGNTDISPDISYQKVINDVTRIYGMPVSVTTDVRGKKVTQFNTTRLKLIVYESIGLNNITTIVSLKS